MTNVFIHWSDSYSVGNQVIDNDHKRLIELINSLHESFSKGEEDSIVGEILDELIIYSQYHFKKEEAIFAENLTPEKIEHINQHKLFIQQVSEFNSQFLHGDIQISNEIMCFMRDWLIHHINVLDKKCLL